MSCSIADCNCDILIIMFDVGNRDYEFCSNCGHEIKDHDDKGYLRHRVVIGDGT